MFARKSYKAERFTERARRVLSLAQEEAQRFQHDYVGTEHFLLGLIREGEGSAAQILLKLGADLEMVRRKADEIVGTGAVWQPGKMGLTPNAKKVLELAVDEARKLNHHYIGSEHLLLGLLRLSECVAVYILQVLGIEATAVRMEIFQVLNAVSQEMPPAQERELFLGWARTERQERKVFDMEQTTGPGEPRGGRDRFDKFDVDACRALSLAQEEAQRFQHNYIGTEHLLLGLVRLDESVVGQVLNRLGIELAKVRSSVEFIIGHGDRIVLGEIGLTPRAKKVVELAVDEARLLRHGYIGTEHILLGLVREGQGIAAGVLESLGVKLERVRAAVLEVLGKGRGLLSLAGAYVRGEKQLGAQLSTVQDADDLVPEPASTDTEDHGNFFTIRSRRVLVRSCEETRQYELEPVSTPRLLLSLLREQNGIAYHVLRNHGLETERLLAAIQQLLAEEHLTEQGNEQGFTTDGKKAITLALEEAWAMTQTAIGSEHLLLGLLRSEGIASGILITRGLTLDKARAEIRRIMGF
ncbi:MAG TPA: Clp protease N-terminal domain-containing protein [Ktedonobacteraceae bacterium]